LLSSTDNLDVIHLDPLLDINGTGPSKMSIAPEGDKQIGRSGLFWIAISSASSMYLAGCTGIPS